LVEGLGALARVRVLELQCWGFSVRVKVLGLGC